MRMNGFALGWVCVCVYTQNIHRFEEDKKKKLDETIENTPLPNLINNTILMRFYSTIETIDFV